MEQIDPTLAETALSLWEEAKLFLKGLFLPWRFYQVAILGGIFAAAHVARSLTAPRVNDWLRSREGWPLWRMRVAVLLRQRIRVIVFVVASWAVYLAMQQMTWPSRSYLIGIAATLATAWLLVGLATKLIRNPLLRGAVLWGAWIYVTLYVLGLTSEIAALLESAAFTLGDFRLSLLTLLKAVVVTVLLLTGARLVTHGVAARVEANRDFSPSMQVLTIKVLQVVLYAAAVLIGLKAVGFDLTSLAVLSGAIGVGLGFGLQKVVSNLVSGMILLLDKSIKPGDVVSLGETFGWINQMGARYVSVLTRDGREYLIPNEDLITNQVVNWSHSNEFVRLDIHFSTSYDDDPHAVRRIAIDAAQTVERVLNHRAPVCHITEFGDSGVHYVLRFWIGDATSGLTNVRGAVYLALWDALKDNGISIPFPQREVRLLPGSTVTLAGSGGGANHAGSVAE
ncbi:mechanosensitive ion channel domain-containing protein [Rhodovulum sp. YNF3179]|uniref:mechanosensitive ion channel family protein n=1 Tax=Rhodovulum sp. YNF3179 TaxID=3425127 RepID=UPI003D354355